MTDVTTANMLIDTKLSKAMEMNAVDAFLASPRLPIFACTLIINATIVIRKPR